LPEHTVRSPLPGVFYRRPAPDQPPFAEEGTAVTADQTIGLVEIMKQYAEVKAGADGSLTAFVAEDQSVLGAGDAVATVDVG
jgi:acetyl-CoA carboxylase biotin carboxyl carrier protein